MFGQMNSLLQFQSLLCHTACTVKPSFSLSNSCRGWERKHLPLCAPYPGGMMDHIIICLRSCKTCNLLLTVPTTHSCDSKQIISMIQFPLSSLKCRQGFWPTSRVGRQGAICFQSASKGDAGVQSLVDLEVPVLNLQPRWKQQWQNQDSLYPEVFVEETSQQWRLRQRGQCFSLQQRAVLSPGQTRISTNFTKPSAYRNHSVSFPHSPVFSPCRLVSMGRQWARTG